MEMKKYIPNTLTCGNVLSGCIATYFAFQGNYPCAFACIILGAVFDFFDGFAARLLHVSSAIGKELDSLADNITFGLAPATIVYSMLTQLGGGDTKTPLFDNLLVATYVPFVAFLMVAFSALRLAKFNLDERQTHSFIGMPTPANALFWGALSISMEWGGLPDDLRYPLFIGFAVLVLVACYMLVAEFPMFALKFQNYGLKGNEVRYGFIVCSVVLLAVFGWIGFSIIIILYVLTSVINNIFGTEIAKGAFRDE